MILNNLSCASANHSNFHVIDTNKCVGKYLYITK